MCWVVRSWWTQCGAIGPDWTVTPSVTDLASGTISWCSRSSSKYTHIAAMTVSRGRRQSFLSTVLPSRAGDTLTGLFQIRLVTVGSIGTAKLRGVLGSVGTVIARLTGCWVLDTRGAKGVVLDGAIAVIALWAGLTASLIFKSKIFSLIYINTFFLVVICCTIIEIKKYP